MKKIVASAQNRQNAKNIVSCIEFMKGDKNMTKADLISFDEIAKKHTAGEYLAICDNGKSYHASYVPKYEPSGVMFFCIPDSVEILGYLEII